MGTLTTSCSFSFSAPVWNRTRRNSCLLCRVRQTSCSFSVNSNRKRTTRLNYFNFYRFKCFSSVHNDSDGDEEETSAEPSTSTATTAAPPEEPTPGDKKTPPSSRVLFIVFFFFFLIILLEFFFCYLSKILKKNLNLF